MEHCSFEFWVLTTFESWCCDLGLPKEGTYGGRGLFLNTQFWGSKDSCRYFVVKTIYFCYYFAFIFQQNMEFCCDSDLILVIQRSTNFCSEFYVHIVVECFVVSKYDEMNCNFVSGFFYIVLWNADSNYMK